MSRELNFNSYEEQALVLQNDINNKKEKIIYAGLGLSGEAGELTDYIKKVMYHGHKLEKEKVIAELGDILWFVTYTASLFDSSLLEVAGSNLKKIYDRYPNGWDKEKSINRKEDWV
ncbi:MAG: hypothetical protein A2Y24_03670 [Clostridiales bacterium GWE2_32_10]|nr:MAG: hypothetical protein A2Y24_03670 [Clostridiales bacterium GWE2_32_10]HBY20977.1 nucleotide pyrophosphohydrolase [Clostridiales bacterium]